LAASKLKILKSYDKSSREARKAYNVLANKVITGSKGEPFNIEDKDVSHSAPQVWPEYKPHKKARNENEIAGYRCQGQVTVKLRNLDDVDAFIDACSELGDDVAVGGVCFDVEDKTLFIMPHARLLWLM
tara:strand:+ start:3635 stop:4021 length:387 start_codon:yes stop_codon:yes gene_type:complete